MKPVSIASLVLLSQVWYASSELFTAIADIEYLLETHKRIIDDLDSYIVNEENRIRNLKRNLNLYKKEHEIAMADIPNYLGNPINAFTLIKRLTSDLDSIEKGINKGTDYIKNITVSHPDLKYPTTEDLSGAAMALTRLKDTYHLEVADLADGKLNGISYSTPMTAGDCYELARVLYNQKDFKNALEWMTVALRKFEDEGNEYDFTLVDIYEYIAYTHYLLGETKTALEWTKKLLILEPNHPRAAGNIPHFQKTIAEAEEKLKKQQRGELGDDPIEEKKEPSAYMKERKVYEKLCRGEMKVPEKVSMGLYCRYQNSRHPFLRLAPIKEEQVYRRPDIFVFHQVLSEREIKEIQDMARPRFKRAVVHDPSTGDLVAAQYRISKSAWLKDGEARAVARVSRRVAHMTGLSVSSAEELQVVNYGVGGHYEPHFDFARKRENAFNYYPGNRIATVLFYMSSVAQGGATVFTELGLSVFPEKHAAVFWHNLHASGAGDLATRHAACPVLRGSKWVSNKWLHQGGQELIKPCSLDFQEESIAWKIAQPVPVTSR